MAGVPEAHRRARDLRPGAVPGRAGPAQIEGGRSVGGPALRLIVASRCRGVRVDLEIQVVGRRAVVGRGAGEAQHRGPRPAERGGGRAVAGVSEGHRRARDLRPAAVAARAGSAQVEGGRRVAVGALRLIVAGGCGRVGVDLETHVVRGATASLAAAREPQHRRPRAAERGGGRAQAGVPEGHRRARDLRPAAVAARAGPAQVEGGRRVGVGAHCLVRAGVRSRRGGQGKRRDDEVLELGLAEPRRARRPGLHRHRRYRIAERSQVEPREVAGQVDGSFGELQRAVVIGALGSGEVGKHQTRNARVVAAHRAEGGVTRGSRRRKRGTLGVHLDELEHARADLTPLAQVDAGSPAPLLIVDADDDVTADARGTTPLQAIADDLPAGRAGLGDSLLVELEVEVLVAAGRVIGGADHQPDV